MNPPPRPARELLTRAGSETLTTALEEWVQGGTSILVVGTAGSGKSVVVEALTQSLTGRKVLAVGDRVPGAEHLPSGPYDPEEHHSALRSALGTCPEVLVSEGALPQPSSPSCRRRGDRE